MRLFKYLMFLNVILLTGCNYTIKTPINSLTYPSASNGNKNSHNPSRLIILLGGISTSVEYFEQHGWTEKLKQRYPEYSLVVPELHYGYIVKDIYSKRLYEDIILPAKQRGIQSIWLVGISLGGLGAILTSDYSNNDIDRLYLLSPFLGNGAVQKQIRQVGSLKKWQAKSTVGDTWEYKLWTHIKDITESNTENIPIYMGYGKQDSMRGLKYLAAALPEKQVISLSGGHKDAVFTMLFERMLELGFFD